MNAVLHTGVSEPWVRKLGDLPWPLLPAGNRPLLEFWLELCVNLGIHEVRIVLGDGAEAIEAYAGDGARWGLAITYSFQPNGRPPDHFLRRNPAAWTSGLLYLRAAAFPTQTGERTANRSCPAGTFIRRDPNSEILCFLSDRPEFIEAFIRGDTLPSAAHDEWPAQGLDPQGLHSVTDYYALNMRLASGEIARYVTPGYYVSNGSCIGYNVVIPPSTTLQPPLLVGNDCRFGTMSVVGPRAVIGNHVVVDDQTELSDCVVLDNSYLGRGLQVRGKIVSGRRMVEPADGAVLISEEPWLLSSVSPLFTVTDMTRAIGGWLIALTLVLIQTLPYLLLRIRNRMRRYPAVWQPVWGCRNAVFPLRHAGDCHGRAPQILCLDLFPRLLAVLRGRLWLCGHRPLQSPAEDAARAEIRQYFPAAICSADARDENPTPDTEAVDLLLYVRGRSLARDVRMLCRLFLCRLKRGLARGADGRRE